MEKLLITIDGTSGVGKGTMAKLLADKYNCHRLDSGAIYRAAAIYLGKLNIEKEDLEDQAVFAQVCDKLKNIPLTFAENEAGVLQVYLDQENITQLLRLETTAAKASSFAVIPEIRTALLERQRKFALDYPRLVAEGRDMGTVVFPQAQIKFFLDASPKAKAERRYKELCDKGEKANFDEILALLEQRDYQDKNRKVAPLVPASDAIVIDTTNLGIEETFAAIEKHLQEK